jgi:hypothetical protein
MSIMSFGASDAFDGVDPLAAPAEGAYELGGDGMPSSGKSLHSRLNVAQSSRSVNIDASTRSINIDTLNRNVYLASGERDDGSYLAPSYNPSGRNSHVTAPSRSVNYGLAAIRSSNAVNILSPINDDGLALPLGKTKSALNVKSAKVSSANVDRTSSLQYVAPSAYNSATCEASKSISKQIIIGNA